MAYTNLGGKPVIPAADLLNLQSEANKPGVGAARVGATPHALGKRPGLMAWRDAGGGDLSMVFSTGGKTSSAWVRADGGATYTPANIVAFDVGADSTYSNGLLTTDGGTDAAGQLIEVVELAAGKYFFSGLAAGEGTVGETPNFTAPRVRVGTGASGSGPFTTRITKVFKSNIHPTAAESQDPKEEVGFTLTLTEPRFVHILIDIVDEANAVSAGSAYITLNPIEAI